MCAVKNGLYSALLLFMFQDQKPMKKLPFLSLFRKHLLKIIG